MHCFGKISVSKIKGDYHITRWTTCCHVTLHKQVDACLDSMRGKQQIIEYHHNADQILLWLARDQVISKITFGHHLQHNQNLTTGKKQTRK